MKKIIFFTLIATLFIISCYNSRKMTTQRLPTVEELEKQGYIVWGKKHWEEHRDDSICVFKKINIDVNAGEQLYAPELDMVVKVMIPFYEQQTNKTLVYNTLGVGPYYISALIDGIGEHSVETARFYHLEALFHKRRSYKFKNPERNDTIDLISRANYSICVPSNLESDSIIYVSLVDNCFVKHCDWSQFKFKMKYNDFDWQNAYYMDEPKIILARKYEDGIRFNKEEDVCILVNED